MNVYYLSEVRIYIDYVFLYPTSPDSTQENKPIALNHCYKDEVAGLNLGEAVREFMIG